MRKQIVGVVRWSPAGVLAELVCGHQVCVPHCRWFVKVNNPDRYVPLKTVTCRQCRKAPRKDVHKAETGFLNLFDDKNS